MSKLQGKAGPLLTAEDDLKASAEIHSVQIVLVLRPSPLSEPFRKSCSCSSPEPAAKLWLLIRREPYGGSSFEPFARPARLLPLLPWDATRRSNGSLRRSRSHGYGLACNTISRDRD